MASRAIFEGGATALPPFALLQQALPRLSRHDLEHVIDLLIDHIDQMDPDPDLEPNGDELDGTNAEDEEAPHGWDGPGCPIADCGEDEHDIEDDYSLQLGFGLYGIDQRQILTRAPVGLVEVFRHD